MSGAAGVGGPVMLGGAAAEAQGIVTLNDGGSHVIDYATTDWYQVTMVC